MSFHLYYQKLHPSEKIALERVFTDPVFMTIIKNLKTDAVQRLVNIDSDQKANDLLNEFLREKIQLALWQEIEMVIRSILDKRTETT